MFLNGELRDGKVKAKDLKIIRQYVLENANELQALWNEYQKSAYRMISTLDFTIPFNTPLYRILAFFSISILC